MSKISLTRALSALAEVGTLTGTGWGQDAIALRKYLQNEGYDDPVQVTRLRNGELLVEYTRAGQPGILRFARSGQVYDGQGSTRPLPPVLDPKAAAVLLWGWGGEMIPPDAITRGAMTLYRCLVTASTSNACVGEAARIGEGARQFLQQARTAGVEAESLAPIETFIAPYAAYRPGGAATSPDVWQRLVAAQVPRVADAQQAFRNIVAQYGKYSRYETISASDCPAGFNGRGKETAQGAKQYLGLAFEMTWQHDNCMRIPTEPREHFHGRF